jgi:hypothetical protein
LKWYWIVELIENQSVENDNQFAYVLGWFDPGLREPVTHLRAWFFPSYEEALTCAITSLDLGSGKTEPNQKLYKFLEEKIVQGKRIRTSPI